MGKIKLQDCYINKIEKHTISNALIESFDHFKQAILIVDDSNCLDFPLIFSYIADIYLINP